MGRGRSPRDYPEDESQYTDYGYEPHASDDDLDSPSEMHPRLDDSALMPYESAGVPALSNGRDMKPVLIPGSGVSMGNPFIKRRERPLTMRLAIVTLMACLLVTGLFAISPLTNATASGGSSFQVLAGSIVYQNQVSYFWYTAQANDTIEGIAAKFNVQIGGIYELNDLLAGQEITIGKAYKIPEDPNYGKSFRPSTYVPPSNGSTTFGNSPWTAIAGNPLPETLCGVDGRGVPTAYDLVAPNPNSFWVRGFRWYHDGVDISTPAGNPIHAAQAGEVIWAGWDVGGLGYSVKINNCWGISTVYGHMESLNVKAGDNVLAGQTIGLEGSTGWSTGPHLHFMVEVNNIPVDPAAYFGFNCDAVTGSTHYALGASCD
jgi:murein DD-endopeptidase MepM/ murein hydrolase activator NlpD